MNDFTINKNNPLTQQQNEVVEFLLKSPVCINATQTGGGKTYTTLTAAMHILNVRDDYECVCLVPSCALKAFRRELQTKLNQPYNQYVSGRPSFMQGARIHLITQSMFEKYINVIVDIRKRGHKIVALVDEYQITQDCSNNFSKNLARVRPLLNILWGLTATPLGNSLEGLYWEMNMLDPQILGSFESFKFNYVQIEKVPMMTTSKNVSGKIIRRQTFREEVVGYKNLDQLQEIISKYIILKQKKYNLKWHYHKTSLSDEELKAYLKAGSGLGRSSSANNFAVRLHDLQMVVDNVETPVDKKELKKQLKKGNPKITDKDVNLIYKDLEKQRRVNILTKNLCSKERLFLQVLISLLKENHAVIVYCDYTDTVARLEMLLERSKHLTGLKKVLKVTGDVTLAERERVEESIEERTVILITSAGTESINLQKADTVVFYNIPFSVLTFIQCVGRITRIDTKHPIQNIHTIEATGTIDSYKRLMLQVNGSLIETIFGEIETLPIEILKTDRNILQKLRQALLWCFNQNKLLSEEQVEKLFYGG